MLLRTRTFREVSGRDPIVVGETNVALASAGGQAAASSTYSDSFFAPSSVIDGVRTTGSGWGVTPNVGWNDHTLNTWPDWVRVQFNGMKRVTHVVVVTIQDNNASSVEPTDSMVFTDAGVVDFTVEGWDGATWQTLGTVTGNNLVKRTVTFAAFTTNYVRLSVQNGLGGYARVVELEVYGVSSAAADYPSPDPGSFTNDLATSFTLVSPNSGTLPFRVGITPKKGQTGAVRNIAISGATAHVVAPSLYPEDNSLSFLEIAGTYTSVANVPTTVTVASGSSTQGTALTAAAITAAAPTCTVQCGGLGTVSLADYYGSPIHIYPSGSKAVQALYATHVATTGIEVRWFVSHWAGSRQKIFWQVTNGPLDNGAGGQLSLLTRTFTLIVIAGGVTAFNASVTLYPHQDVNGEAWIGGDPQVTALPDPVQLTASKRVGNYTAGGAPAESALAALQVTYTPGIANPHKAAMAGPGGADQIGLLPLWDSFYPCSGDARAWKASQIGARQIGAFAFNWRSFATHRAPKPSSFPNWSFFGNHGASSVDCQADINYWDFNHAPSVGYLPYLLTADAFYYERCLDNAAINYVARGEQDGTGLSRVMRHAARGLGWSIRSVAQAAAIAHTGDDVAQEYREMLGNQFGWLANRLRTNYQAAPLGISFIFNQEQANEISLDEGYIRTFMQFYLAQAIAATRDLHLFSDPTDVNLVGDGCNKFITGLGGVSGDPAQFAFTHVTEAYSLKIATTPTSGWYTDFGTVFSNTYMLDFGINPNNTVSNTLYGQSSGIPSEAYDGYWGYYRCALAYAVDQNYPGAVEVWRRIEAADNASDLTGSRFDLKKTWAIEPRNNTALPAWRTAMSPLDVVTFSGTEFWSQPTAPGGSEALNWFAYSGGVVHQASCTLVMIGSGHSDGYRNGAWGVRLNQEVPAMVRLAADTPEASMGYDWQNSLETGHSPYGDGRPAARHTSWALSSDEAHGRIILHGAWAFAGNGNGGSLAVDALDLTAGDYVTAGSYTALSASPGQAGGFAPGASNKVYMLAQNQHLYRWQPSATSTGAPGVINDLGDTGQQYGLEVALGCDPTRNIVFRIGQGSANIPSYWFDQPNGGTSHAFTLQGDAGAVFDLRANRHHFEYDDALDCFWVWRRQTATPTLYKLTITGTSPSLTFTVSAAQTLNGTITNAAHADSYGYGRFGYVRYLRGLVWYQGSDGGSMYPARFIATSNFT